MSPYVAIVFIIICIFVFFGLVVFLGAPYVPSHKKDVTRVFEYLGLGSTDVLVDVGSGDGIILRIAARYGAQAVGYEINPILVGTARLLSLREPKVKVLLQNFWHATVPKETTLVYAFAVLRDEKKLINLLQGEANRHQKSIKLICYGSPFRSIPAIDTFEAYHIYIFQPLQLKNA
ncbi:hypothetical protein H7100_02870 [Candidatus Saccharibacteria bacterium]|nr:hypothetical protein [Candidatus Saccharibacteria bacterium]